MVEAHKLDCDSVSETCRFIIQSEDEEEAIELTQNHMKEVHDQDLTAEELREDVLEVV